MSISENNVPNETPLAKRPQRTRRLLRWVEHLLACTGLCFIFYHLCFEVTVMTSDSMAPALNGTCYENGDSVLLEKVTGRFLTPRRWEIYFFYDSEGNPVAKRVVGLPGERIAIKKNEIYINGTPLQRPINLQTNRYFGYGSLANNHEVDCGKGYFMLGDASADSLDSRYTGIVTRDRFRGRAWCILWPSAHAGFVK
jgi:signal peptidase I